jgi:hypothetical protein
MLRDFVLTIVKRVVLVEREVGGVSLNVLQECALNIVAVRQLLLAPTTLASQQTYVRCDASSHLQVELLAVGRLIRLAQIK